MGSLLDEPRSAWTSTDPVHPLKAQNINTEALTAKYQEERAKRLRADGFTQFKPAQGTFSHFKDDIQAPSLNRKPINAETKVLIVGAGLAGVGDLCQIKGSRSGGFLDCR